MEIVQSAIRAPRIGDVVTLCPIGDLQLGGDEADVEHFKRHLEWCMQQPNPRFIGLGDYVDVASPSNRQKLRAAGLYDNVEKALDEICHQHVEHFLKLVKGTEGLWLGLVEGHHFWNFPDGTTSSRQ